MSCNRVTTKGLSKSIFDIYLSEMSVSDRHGGGLTLQRILGADLGFIDKFYHVSRFAEDYAPVDAIATRSRTFPFWAEKDTTRLWIGFRPSGWLARRLWLQSLHCGALVNTILSEVDRRKPLRVLTCPQGVLSLLAMRHLRRAGNVKYVTWLMDDHLLRYQNGNWEYPSGVRKLMGDHLRAATQVLVISPSLGEFYRREFGVDYKVLFGPADQLEEPMWHAPSIHRARLGYFGNIGEWQLDGLAKLSHLLPCANATLDVFSAISQLPPSLQLPGVRLRGQVGSRAVIQEMRGYDAVVVPIGFSDSLRHLSEFNIATKMSECLASGTATLVVGPKHAAMVNFLEPYKAAWIETALTPGSFAANVSSVLSLQSRMERLANARDLVRRALSTTAMRDTWLSVVSSMAVLDVDGERKQCESPF